MNEHASSAQVRQTLAPREALDDGIERRHGWFAMMIWAKGNADAAVERLDSLLKSENSAALERELCKQWRLLGLKAQIASAFNELRSEGKLPPRPLRPQKRNVKALPALLRTAMSVYDIRRRLAKARQARHRHSLSWRALGAFDRVLTAFAVGAAFGNPWAWVVIFAAFALVAWISYK